MSFYIVFLTTACLLHKVYPALTDHGYNIMWYNINYGIKCKY